MIPSSDDIVFGPSQPAPNREEKNPETYDIGQKVKLKLQDGRELEGKLTGFDTYKFQAVLINDIEYPLSMFKGILAIRTGFYNMHYLEVRN